MCRPANVRQPTQLAIWMPARLAPRVCLYASKWTFGHLAKKARSRAKKACGRRGKASLLTWLLKLLVTGDYEIFMRFIHVNGAAAAGAG